MPQRSIDSGGTSLDPYPSLLVLVLRFPSQEPHSNLTFLGGYSSLPSHGKSLAMFSNLSKHLTRTFHFSVSLSISKVVDSLKLQREFHSTFSSPRCSFNLQSNAAALVIPNLSRAASLKGKLSKSPSSGTESDMQMARRRVLLSAKTAKRSHQTLHSYWSKRAITG